MSHLCDGTCQHTNQHHPSTQKKNYFILFFDWYILTTNFLFYFFFIFTLCMKKPERKAKAGAETCDITSDWYVCFHYFSQGCWRTLTHV